MNKIFPTIYNINIQKIHKFDLGKFEVILSEDEKIRADRFIFGRDRKRFVVTRGKLRVILSEYLQQSPESIKFSYTDKGKPYFTNSDIYFNVWHSHEIAFYGINKEKEIGVDVEYYLRNIDDLEGLAKRFFREVEYKKIANVLDKDEKQKLFFKYWTLKEAYLKATGEGVCGLEKIDFEILEKKQKFSFKDKNIKQWTAFFLQPLDGYLGVVVV